MNIQANGIIGFLILFLDIWAIIKTVQSNVSALKKTVWILIILFLPILGLILWYILGPKS